MKEKIEELRSVSRDSLIILSIQIVTIPIVGTIVSILPMLFDNQGSDVLSIVSDANDTLFLFGLLSGMGSMLLTVLIYFVSKIIERRWRVRYEIYLRTENDLFLNDSNDSSFLPELVTRRIADMRSFSKNKIAKYLDKPNGYFLGDKKEQIQARLVDSPVGIGPYELLLPASLFGTLISITALSLSLLSPAVNNIINNFLIILVAVIILIFYLVNSLIIISTTSTLTRIFRIIKSVYIFIICQISEMLKIMGDKDLTWSRLYALSFVALTLTAIFSEEIPASRFSLSIVVILFLIIKFYSIKRISDGY